jgi:probable addiction module antidote protein
VAKTKTRRWDAAEHLKTDEDRAAYLEAALEEDDPALVSAALGDIARAKGMTGIARETGLGRESLYKALSPEGNPELSTVLKVVRALGLRLHATSGMKFSKRDAEVFFRVLANPPAPSAALREAAARYRKRRA